MRGACCKATPGLFKIPTWASLMRDIGAKAPSEVRAQRRGSPGGPGGRGGNDGDDGGRAAVRGGAGSSGSSAGAGAGAGAGGGGGAGRSGSDGNGAAKPPPGNRLVPTPDLSLMEINENKKQSKAATSGKARRHAAKAEARAPAGRVADGELLLVQYTPKTAAEEEAEENEIAAKMAAEKAAKVAAAAEEAAAKSGAAAAKAEAKAAAALLVEAEAAAAAAVSAVEAEASKPHALHFCIVGKTRIVSGDGESTQSVLSGKQLSERRRERERGSWKVEGAFAQPARGEPVWQFKREHVAARKIVLTKSGKMDAGSLRRARYAIRIRAIGVSDTESDSEGDDNEDDGSGSGTDSDGGVSGASGSPPSSDGDDGDEDGGSGSGSGSVVEGAKRKASESRSERAARRDAAVKSPVRKSARGKKA